MFNLAETPTDNSTMVRKHFERWEFDNYAEFLDEIERPITPEEEQAWGHGLSSHDYGRDWNGTRTWQEAIDLSRNGWEEGRENLAETMERVLPYVIAALPQQSMDLAPAGYLPDVPAFCAGSPACMHNAGDTFNARTPVLRMLVNMGGLANVRPQAWISRGAAICGVVDYFEQTGTSVEIELVSVAQGYGSRMVEVNVPLKRAGEHIEPDRLAFALGNPAMLRRFIFSLREKSTGANVGGGYGSSVDATPDADQIYFPKLVNSYIEPENALKLVLKRVLKEMEAHQKVRVSEDWEEILGDSRAAY